MAARAQQMPVVGFFNTGSPEANVARTRAFQMGLKEMGYVDGENVAVVYRWGENNPAKLPELAADLVLRRVSVLVTYGDIAATVAKAATATIPIVFGVSEDPVKNSLVTSIARPGGNATGINSLIAEIAGKRLDLLRELVPRMVKVGVLIDPASPTHASILQETKAAADARALKTIILNASNSGEINTAFAALVRTQPDALFVSSGFLFLNRRVQLVNLTSRHGIPATFPGREYVEAGGLMSYGPDIADVFRQIGVYTGRILKGAKPADLPVVQSSKFELVINNETARLLALNVPATLLARADEVIE